MGVRMNKSAVLHIPISQYAFARSERTITLRIRTAKQDITSCKVYYGDRACKKTPVEFFELPMKRSATDELFDYFEVTFDSLYQRVCYYFRLETEDEWFYYYADQFSTELPNIKIDGDIIEGRSEYYQYPFVLRSEIPDVPKWFKDAIVYNIFPDSFASSKGVIDCEKKTVVSENNIRLQSRLGGTIRGIKDNLDYIASLGVNCIYLNPIFMAGEYHKYDTLDYFHIDPCFGTDEDFYELVHQVHKRKMKIIIDGVFNHSSWYFFAFQDVVEQGEKSKYKDWFYDLQFPVIRPTDEAAIPSYTCFAYERKMPKLNTAKREVQEYFCNVCKYWIREFGIDGWRLDVANEIDRNFWRAFRMAAKSENPEVVLIGEVWENSEVWLRGDMFDSTMNYDFRKHCRDFFALGTINGDTFIERITQMQLRYPTNVTLGQLNLLDSHDVPRFLSLCNNDIQRWKLAVIFLLLSPGVPSIFYGDEKGISGIKENEYRSPMIWESSKNDQTEFVQGILSIRKQYTDFHSEFVMKVSEGNKGLFAFSRIGKKGNLSIYLNVSKTSNKIELHPDRKVLLQQGMEGCTIEPNGYIIFIDNSILLLEK